MSRPNKINDGYFVHSKSILQTDFFSHEIRPLSEITDWIIIYAGIADGNIIIGTALFEAHVRYIFLAFMLLEKKKIRVNLQ